LGGEFSCWAGAVGQDEEFEEVANSLGAGDELILSGGVYSQSGRRAVTAKGTVEAPILIRAAEGARPVLTRPAGDMDRHNNIEFVDCSYLVVRGIHFEGGSCGVRFIRGHHVTFENCEISRTGNNALTMNSGDCDSFVIRGNHIHHLRGTSGGGNDGIEFKFGSWGNTIRDNVIHNTNIGRQYPGIFVYGGGKGVNVVEGNVIWRAGEGIQVVSDAIVRNNVILDCSAAGITAAPHGAVPKMRNVKIVHNTIVNHPRGVRIRWGKAEDMVFANNAVYCPKGMAIDAAGIEDAAISGNCVAGRLGGVGIDGGRFLDGGSLAEAFRGAAKRDFRPGRGSALIGKADKAYTAAHDFDHNKRVGPFEAGAYELIEGENEKHRLLRDGFKVIETKKASGAETVVKDSQQLQAAIRAAKPGSVILLGPGEYRGGIYIQGISGTRLAPIVIKGQNASNRPLFSGGGGQAFHLSDCNHVVLADLVVKGFASNGINIDDGGTFETPSTYITLLNVSIFETGPTGNHDALKMSGVDHFVVRRCRFEGWGGSGIDMVGCHEGVVTECVFVGRKGFSQSNGVQMKGASSSVLVERCLFRDAGRRSINCGGSTGLAYFRPKVGDFEARDITIAGNRFVGSMAPVAWVTGDGGHVHHNTILFPDKWVLRILQETRDERFGACHDGVFEENVIVYDSRVSVFVNVGPQTAPGTFTFRRNAWCPVGDERKPVLPAVEADGIYGVAVVPDKIDLVKGRVHIDDPRVRRMGADGYRR